MKKLKLLLLGFIIGTTLLAQEKLYIHTHDKSVQGVPLSMIDSITFNSSRTTGLFGINGAIYSFLLNEIDSLSLGQSNYTITIIYDGEKVTVNNPLYYEGVSVKVENSQVTVYSTTEVKDIQYVLKGSTSNGSFKIYSEKRFSLILNGIEMTHPDGPAMNIQAKNKVSVTLADGTNNILTDGAIYAASITNEAGEAEDQKAAFFSEGKLIFDGSGSLTINSHGSEQHALSSDDYIEITSGSLTVTSAEKDGLHGKDGIIVSGGTLKINSTGDGLDGDEGAVLISGGQTTIVCPSESAKGIGCDSTLNMTGGTVDITMSGNQSKGLKCDQMITLSGGELIIRSSGGVALESSGSGYDPKYSTAIKCDSLIVLSGTNIAITLSGIAGKGISSDNSIQMSQGTINIVSTGKGATYKNPTGTTDSYTSACITSDVNIVITGGSLTTNSSGSGGKGISCDGNLTIGDSNHSPIVNVTTSGSKITVSSSGSTGGGTRPGGGGGQTTGNYDEAKAIKCNGDVNILNGIITISSADDGIKSNKSITISQAEVTLKNAIEGMESPKITLQSGTISISASDDGFNATSGNGGESNDGSLLQINGGTIYVSTTTGDGLDSNGSIAMTAGTVIVNGPSSSPEVGMDYNGTFNISGGLLAVSGPNSGNMIQATSTTSSQYSVKITSSTTLSSSTIIHVQDDSGNNLLTFKPARNYYYIIFSSPDLKTGTNYSIYTGGSSTGTATNGYYSNGTYSGGTLKKSFTLSGKVTAVSF